MLYLILAKFYPIFFKTKRMKRFFLTAGALFFTVMVFAQLPATTIKDLNTGKKIAFNQTIEKGKVTLISFWATWCIPCKREIKNLSAALPKWKTEADFNYMTVSIDESRAEDNARTYAISQGWNFPIYIDVNSDLKRSLSFQNVPFTVIIDKQGKIAFTHTGYEQGGEAEILAKLKELAAAK